MGKQATAAGIALVAIAFLALWALGGTSAQATCELSHSASTCAYALR